jgi:hypothetical protein
MNDISKQIDLIGVPWLMVCFEPSAARTADIASQAVGCANYET